MAAKQDWEADGEKCHVLRDDFVPGQLPWAYPWEEGPQVWVWLPCEHLHSFSKHELSSACGPGTVLGSGVQQ